MPRISRIVILVFVVFLQAVCSRVALAQSPPLEDKLRTYAWTMFDRDKLPKAESARLAAKKADGTLRLNYTMMIAEIVASWGKITEEARADIRPYVNPDAAREGAAKMLPRLSAALLDDERSYITSNFEIRYSTTDEDDKISSTDTSPSNGFPDYVEDVGEALENSYSVEIEELDFPEPQKAAGESRYIVYLGDLIDAASTYGFAVPFPYTDDPVFPSASELFLDHDFYDELDDMKVTAAHEFFHAMQFGTPMIVDFSDWIWESTATWSEDKVYPDINQYTEYLNGSMGRFDYPESSLDAADQEYGNAIFFKYLEEVEQLENATRFILEYCQQETTGITAIKEHLLAVGEDFGDVFMGFAESMVSLQGYADGSLYDGAKVQETDSMNLSDTGQFSDDTISKLGFMVYEISAASDGIEKCLELDFSGFTSSMRIGIVKKLGTQYKETERLDVETTNYFKCDFGETNTKYFIVVANTSESDSATGFVIDIEQKEFVEYSIGVQCNAWNLMSMSAIPLSSGYEGTIAGSLYDMAQIKLNKYLPKTSTEFEGFVNGNIYWIYPKCDQSDVHVNGVEQENAEHTYTLEPGWNGLGSTTRNGFAWNDSTAVFQVGTSSYTLSQAISAGIIGDKLYYYDPESGYVAITANSSESVEPWRGYIIKVYQACTLTVN